jgi:enterochelin esterase-like enzyme
MALVTLNNYYILKNLLKHTFQSLSFALLFTQLTGAQTIDDFYPASSNITGSEYPKISGDSRISLRLRAPDAIKVQVQGGADFYPKPVDMIKDAGGNWNITLPAVVPGFHYYWFIVDGIQVNDPGSDTYHGYSKPTSGIEIPTPGEDFYLAKNVPHGEVREHWYFSDITGKWRRAFVYTPPDYETNPKKKYPVLFLLHGMGENERGWTLQGHLSFIMDNLIADRKATQMIVVMDNGIATAKNIPAAPAVVAGAQSPGAGMPANRNSALEEVYVKEILPSVESFYRTKPGRENCAMAGLSMGGGQTAMIGLNHLELFSSFGFFSSGITANALADTKTAYKGAFADAASFNKKVKVFWFGAGTAETALLNRHADVKKKLADLGIKSTFYESQGTAHEWHTWRRCLNEFAPLLFK